MKPFLLVLVLISSSVQAQLRLPQLPNPSLPVLTEPLQRLLPLRPLSEPLRSELLKERLRRDPAQWMQDRQGLPVLRKRLLWLTPSAGARAQAEAAGWQLRPLELEGLGLRVWQLSPPDGLDALAAQERLQALDAEGEAELEHLYLPAGALSAGVAPQTGAIRAGEHGRPRIGLIDTGVDARHPALAGLAVQTLGCAPRAHAHGTAVASLLVGQAEGLRSAYPGAALAAVDIDCGEPGGSSASRLVLALDALLRAGVPVVNISLVGPPNRLLQAAVAAAQAKGQLLVAAAGNDGPAAAPLYPAAYEGVIGVAATDLRRRPLPESARGAQVSASATGAAVVVAQLGEGLATARGSSFAAPWLAGRLAAAWGEGPPSPERAARLRAALQAQLDDLGKPGRDPIYGWGWAGPRWALQAPQLQ